MNNLVRTTIILPSDLYESLRLEAFQQKTSFSGIVKKKLVSVKAKKPGKGIMSLVGIANKFGKANKPYNFNREKFYEEESRHRGFL